MLFRSSGTSTDGKNFSVDLSADEMSNLQRSVADNLSKTFNTDSGLALRTSYNLADNQVFSDTSLKSDMDAYSKAHNIAEKYSENYSRTDSDSASFGQKIMPEITKQFIQNDERLKAMYESGNLAAAKAAINDATYRIDKAYSTGVGSDWNNLNNAFITITGFDAKGNLTDNVNKQLDEAKNINTLVQNQIATGQEKVSNATIKNDINQNPRQNYDDQVKDRKSVV